MVYIIFQLVPLAILLIWLICRQYTQANRALHEAWQDSEVKFMFGVPNGKCRAWLSSANEGYFNSRLFMLCEAMCATWEGDDFGLKAQMTYTKDNCGESFVLVAIQVDAYASYMSERALKYRDIVFDAWTNRPDYDWRDILKLEVSGPQAEIISKAAEGRLSMMLKLPKEIQEKMDDPKQRKEFLKHLNIQ